MNSVRTSRRIAVIAALVAIPVGIWGIRFVGRQDQLAGIAQASAAAATHNCNLGSAAIGQSVSQVRSQSTIGWAESGSDVAKSLDDGCRKPVTPVHASS
ncbi:MAG: hypothetical protein KGJ66_11785 [Alphaproteobacteria bacterium]|nr:hypothetical protein [Alphaproteobacteria bacterium]